MKRNDSGLFIVIEGIDGTGKSTQSAMLQTAIEKAGYNATQDFEPTNGTYGKMLRDSAVTGRMSPEEELDLFHKDRKEHVTELILPELNKGNVVILDRYYFSTMAYQGQRGFDRDDLRKTNEAFAPVPDILFILDLPVDLALERIGVRGDTANEFEQADALQYCRDTFLSVSHEPFAHVISSDQTIDEIHQQMLKIALQALAEKNS